MTKPHIIMESNDEQVTTEATESTVDTGAEDNTDWKAKAIEFETKYKAENGVRRRVEKDLKQYTSSKTESQTESQPQDKKGFDYAQKAYLKSSGINSDEFDFVKEVMDATGKTDIDAILGSKYFQAELKERREIKATEAATPPGTKRAGNSTSNTVDYWLAKIAAGTATIADISDRKLRQDVVNARIKAEGSKSQFATQAVVK
jgi:hypothetical protein